MKVRVRFFALARELAEERELEVELAEGATIAQLRQELRTALPALAPIVGALSFAIDDRYVDSNTSIPPSAIVDCFPPVSGG